MDFKLTELESQSALWQKIEKELKARLQMLREKNDNDMEPLDTARIRGEIKTIKAMLAWAQALPTIN